jgi:bile acid:Na+ symporter, BASS family
VQQTILMIVLATMVYAVSLELKLADFRYVAKHPRAVLVGLVAQFALLPVATWLVTLWLDLPPAVEAAMMLVASCPGGALSNVITHFGRGNLALSLSISAVSNVLALFLTPLNFAWMVAANPATSAWAKTIAVDPKDLMLSLFALLAVPLTAALLTQRFAPTVAGRIRKPLENLALVALFVFIVGAVAGQWKTFVSELTQTLPVVIGHNALGLGCGYVLSLLAKLPVADRRAVVIEGGMQNSGLALGLIALQFGGDLAMVAVAGLWGIWHIVSGGTLALLWRRLDVGSRAGS